MSNQFSIAKENYSVQFSVLLGPSQAPDFPSLGNVDIPLKFSHGLTLPHRSSFVSGQSKNIQTIGSIDSLS